MTTAATTSPSRMGTAPGGGGRRREPPHPRADGFPVPIADEVHRCSHCGTPMFLGRLGAGSAIEIKCRRRECEGHRRPVRFVKLG